ncbi:hypothetical protein BGW38_000677 [Lunasporangiospora selenospora]|uniref:Uncharacterized protein n=1 Tax=Lunasporangiospora selenospora TaxID=979761 RepID=A0A9P6FVB6_9FUNG|nr:hypothetical protein BGW38_000677 [Lunasporangiospora selenospora]
MATECSSPTATTVTTTVTKIETLTVWNDKWPVSTITQQVIPDNCPPAPRYSCFVVETTLLTAPIPQATIHLVLPQSNDFKNKYSRDLPQGEINKNPTSDSTAVVEEGQKPPECVHYATELRMGPCPTYSAMPVNSEGCAIITSTSMATATITAVPEQSFQKEDLEIDLDLTYTYSYSIGPAQPFEKPTILPLPWLSTSMPTPSTTTLLIPDDPTTSSPTPTPTLSLPPPSSSLQTPVSEQDHLLPITGTSETSWSKHLSYTVSFQFSYGTFPTRPTTTVTTRPLHLPGPEVTTPSSPMTSSRDDETQESSTTTVTDPKPTFAKNSAEGDRDKPEQEESKPSLSDPTPTTTTLIDPQSSELADPSCLTPSSTLADPPSPKPALADPILKKACSQCAELCIVDLDKVLHAEVSLLVRFFEEKIQTALSGLQKELEQTAHTAFKSNEVLNQLFHKSCEEKIEAIQQKHVEVLKAKSDHVVQGGCETGQCLQSELGRALGLLDVMVSTELGRDCSRLRQEIVQDFKHRCEEQGAVEKRGLLDHSLITNLVGLDLVGNGLSSTVNSLVQTVEAVVEGLGSNVASVVDRFVLQCQRKGFLDETVLSSLSGVLASRVCI